MNRIESRGVRCLECKAIDLQTHKAQAKTGFGQCTAADPVRFVSAVMARNCADFEPAAPDVVEVRDTWAAKIPMFWQR